MVQEYYAVGNEAGERMIAMIQQELDRDNRYTIWGMVLAFLSFLVMVAAAIYMGIIGSKTGIVSFTSATCLGLATNFLRARR